MAVENDSSVTEFILRGLTHQTEVQLPLFFLFLVNCVVTVMGNLSLINLICISSHLHTLMYFFLFNLSFIDICYSFVFTPKMLMGFNSERNIISFAGCMVQLFFFCFFVSSECYVLTAMAYDCYIDCYMAICNPLLYTVTMAPHLCPLLMFASYMMGLAAAMAHTGCMISLKFSDSSIIKHYMYDMFSMLLHSCITTNELIASIIVDTVVIVSSHIICISYVLILFNILHLSSANGWSKAFCTCSSHLLTVGLFYGFGLLTYVNPSSSGSLGQEKLFSVFYTNVVPMLNPLVYRLRNKDVKLALKKSLKRITKGAEAVVLP